MVLWHQKQVVFYVLCPPPSFVSGKGLSSNWSQDTLGSWPLGALVCIQRSDHYIESLLFSQHGPLHNPSTPVWQRDTCAHLCTCKQKRHYYINLLGFAFTSFISFLKFYYPNQPPPSEKHLHKHAVYICTSRLMRVHATAGLGMSLCTDAHVLLCQLMLTPSAVILTHSTGASHQTSWALTGTFLHSAGMLSANPTWSLFLASMCFRGPLSHVDPHLAKEQVVFVSDADLFPPINVPSMCFFWYEAVWLGEFVQSQQYCTMAGIADYMGNIRL